MLIQNYPPGSHPRVGDVLRDAANNGTKLFTVAEVFDAGKFPGMLLDWYGYNINYDRYTRRGQAFTCENWRTRWEVIAHTEPTC